MLGDLLIFGVGNQIQSGTSYQNLYLIQCFDLH